MAEENNYTALIDRYLSGELTTTEQVDFEAQLAVDPQLEKELKLHQAIHAALELEGDDQLKAELEDIHDDFMCITTKTLWLNKGWWLMGVLALVVGVITLILYWEDPQHEYHKVEKTSPDAYPKEVLPLDTLSNVHDEDSVQVKENDTVVTQRVEADHLDNKAFSILQKQMVIDSQMLYDFEGQTLMLYNFTGDLKNVDLRIHANELYLYYKGGYYKIVSGDKGEPLKKVSDVRDFETLKYASGTGPKITIEKRRKYMLQDSLEIKVFQNAQLTENQVDWDPSEMELFVSGKTWITMKGNGGQIIQYSNGESTFVLEVNQESFLLMKGKHLLQPRPNTSQLLEKVVRSIRHETVEDSYFNQESQ